MAFREQKIRQLFAASYIHIYFTGYVHKPKWWSLPGKEDWWSSTNTFGCNAIYYITEGELEFTIEGHTHRPKAGQLLYIPAGTPHTRRICPENPAKKYYVHYDLQFGKDSLDDFFQIPHMITINDTEGFSALFEQFRQAEHKENGPADALACNGLLLQLLCFILRDSNLKPILPETRSIASLQVAVQYIHGNLHRAITIAELAKLTGYSPGHFTKNFKKLYHCLPLEYIASVKLDRAKEQLRATRIPIAAIAEELGFHDASHFGKFFKNHTGMTPAVYRHTVIHRV